MAIVGLVYDHNIKGNNILPNPPINISIIIEDVINIPWKVILKLYSRSEHSINPSKANSNHNIKSNIYHSNWNEKEN